MSNNELLMNISSMLDEKLEPITIEIVGIKRELIEVKEDVSGLKEDVENLKGRVDILAEEVTGLKEDVAGINYRLDTVIEPDIHNIKLRLENGIEPDIRLLAENYVPAAKRYETEIKRLDILQTDMSIVKKVVNDHSARLQKLTLQG